MTVENISIAVKTTGADTAARHINSLVASLEKLEKATTSMTGVANLAELGKAFSTLASNRVSVSSFNSIAKGVERLGEALKSLSVEDAHILDKVTASMARLQGVDLKGFGSAVSAAHRVGEASQQAQMAVSEDVQSIIENASQVDILTHKLDGLKDALQEAFNTGNIEKAYALRGQILQVEDAIKRATEAAKKSSSAFGSFFASLKRIAMYRALRTIIKAITQAIKEGLENVYEWSKAGGDMGEIAGALDRITSAGAQLKNQLGAAFGELLVALEPIIIALINLLTQLAQALTWVIALLSGKGYYPVAKQITKDWKEATGAANAYKNTILGFDEINRLNDEGGGGGGSPSGIGFEYDDLGIGLGDWWPKTFEWISKFKDDIDGGIGKIKDFVAELATIPELIPVEIEVKVPDFAFDPLLALEPLLIPVEIAILGDPLPLLQALRLALVELAAESPVLVAIKSFVESPIPVLQAIAAEAGVWLTELQNEFVTAYQGITETVQAWETAYASASATVQAETISIYNDVNSFVERTKERLSGWALSVTTAIVLAFSTVAGAVSGALENARTNINIFVNQTLPEWWQWALSVDASIRSAFEGVAESAYQGLLNAGTNIVSFLSSSASSVWSWATGTLKSFASWASGVAQNIASALSSAWKSVKSFFESTGQAVNGFFEEHPIAKTLIFGVEQPTTTFPNIPLIPGWIGGGALVPAFALGGSIPNSDGTLFVAGEAGPEIVANMGSRTGVMNVEQMEAAVANGNIGVINAVYQMANMIVKAVNEIDPDITLDGESLADKMYNYNQNAAKRRGVTMVT